MVEGHEELRELVAAYVLGAVSAEEAERVRDHLATCEECRSEASEYADVAASLALAVEPDPLPEGFAERVLARLALPDAPAPPTSESRAPPTSEAAAPHAPPTRAHRPRRKRSWLGHGLAYAALAITIAILAANLWTLQRESQRDQRLLWAIVRYEGMWLRGEGDVAGRMMATEDGGLFVASGLPEAPSGRTYQLWLIDASGPESGGTFEASEGVAVVRTEKSLEHVEGVAVTVERPGGSARPTSEPVIRSV
jgi:anti-sigma-K factor RskA